MIGLRRWWRERILKRAYDRIDPSLWAAVWPGLPLLDGLSPEETRQLRDLAALFLRAKAIEPAAGLTLTDDMRLTVALQACLPILHLGLQWYSGWHSVVLYPSQFRPEHEWIDEHGIAWRDSEPLSGEAWERGPVILSWEDVTAGGVRDGFNLVIHELAHKLDMRSGAANGHPPLHADMSDRAWADALGMAYADLSRRIDHSEVTPIDAYAAESPAELFAVCTEAFFEVPHALRESYPATYEQLARFYRQDPASRLPPV